jgi:hypothetical protein
LPDGKCTAIKTTAAANANATETFNDLPKLPLAAQGSNAKNKSTAGAAGLNPQAYSCTPGNKAKVSSNNSQPAAMPMMTKTNTSAPK